MPNHPNVAIPVGAFTPTTTSEYFNDFIASQGISGGSIGAASGNSIAVGSAAAQDANHPGNFQIISGTGGTGTGEYGFVGGTYTAAVLNTAPAWSISTSVYLSAVTSARFAFGFMNAVNANPPTDGFYFVYDSSVGTPWHCATAASSTTTDASSGINAAASTWTRLKIAFDGTSAIFYINGVKVASSSTNIPSLILRLAWQAIALSASSVYLVSDYIYWSRAVTR